MKAHSIIRKMFERLVEPKSFGEESRRREFLVNVVLIGTIFLSSLLLISTVVNIFILGKEYRGISITCLSLIFLSFVAIYNLSRIGYSKIASYLTVGVYLLGAGYQTWRWGVELPESILPYTLILIMATLIVSPCFGFFVTGLIATNLLIAHIAQINQWYTPDTAWKQDLLSISDTIEQILIYLIIALISWLYAREIEKSLSRARASEEALRRERDALEETLAIRTRELREAHATRISHFYRFVEFGKLASGIFHDLIGSLTSVTLSIEELPSRKNQNYTDNAIEKAIVSSKKLCGYVKAIRRQMNNQEHKDYFEPKNIITDAILLTEYQARKSNTKITTDFRFAGNTYGNSLKFHQIIINLISNALYACQKTASRQIKIRLWEESSVLKLSVKDTGSGMNETTVQRIFEPFFTTKSEMDGTGLGLSTTKHIVEKDFGGTIFVESKINEGTLFTISIPIRKKHENTTKETTEHKKSDSYMP